MSVVVITGARGLVGSHLLPLFSQADELHVLVRSRSTEYEGLPNVRQHVSDLAGHLDLSSLPPRIDSVVHLAQSPRFREFPEQALDVFDVNVSSLVRLLDYARRAGAKSFLIASSGGLYGSSKDPVREDTQVTSTGQLGFYLSSKLCSEILAESYAAFMNVTVLRLFFVYGPGQRRSMLIPRLIDSVRFGKGVALSGPEGIRINPIHALDAAVACKAALTIEGMRMINVAGPETHTLREICHLIGVRLGIEPVFDFRPASEAEDLVADITLMKNTLVPPGRLLADHLHELL